MQGRLSPLVDGRIQAFPWETWEEEFHIADRIDIRLMEWTLDQERLLENPIMTEAGRTRVRDLSQKHDVQVPSLTGDCFMQAPFWKMLSGSEGAGIRDFEAVVDACSAAGIEKLVVPLVDNGRLENQEQETCLVDYLSGQSAWLRSMEVKVVFESDFGPAELSAFIARLDADLFGINYDIGNSAALGFSAPAEISAYGDRVLNVHVKDRLRGGTTVPLGTGNADFIGAFASLAGAGYTGNFILQTARAVDADHEGALQQYAAMTTDWVGAHAA